MYLVTTCWSNPSIDNMHRVQSLEEAFIFLEKSRKEHYPTLTMERVIKCGWFRVYRTELNTPIQLMNMKEMKELFSGMQK